MCVLLHMRYGGHISAGVRIVSAAWPANRTTDGAMHIVGLMLAVTLAGFSFALPFVPMFVFFPVSVLLIAWLALSVRLLARGAVEPCVAPGKQWSRI